MFFRIHLKILIPKEYCLILLLTVCFVQSFSQNKEGPNPVIDSFNEYTKTQREIAYAHLNKSIYIKGETFAFCVYVFDKTEKKPSQLTTNLYCSISDDNGDTVKSKMLLVTNGIAHGSFFVDSLFTSGNYTFKAYTNWMKNFDEQNFYIESIKVIDPEIETDIVTKVISSKLDAQFLPEGGYLLSDVTNTMGIVIKDSLGFGVPFVEGRLLNSKSEIINTFKTNQFGISKFIFTPKANELYQVSIDFEETKQIFDIDLAEIRGITLSLNYLKNRVILRFVTNANTLDFIKNKIYHLTIHNGSEIKASDVIFTDNEEILQFINYDDLFSGLNVFTLFDEQNNPLLERLFFKYDGIQLIETGEVSYEKEGDSIMVSIPIKGIDSSQINHFSVSVLPEGTKSYRHDHNIISYTYLQPYVRGFVENANYYFTDITGKKKYELDNLLLTQGWSSYSWNTIFNNPQNNNYTFETGIGFKANVNATKTGKFILYPISNNGLEIFDVNDTIKTFEKNGLYPFDGETLKFSEISKNKSAKKSGLYLQFSPSKIPDLDKYTKFLPLKENVFFNSKSSQPLLETSWSEFEQLDEVIITVNKEKERIEKLKNSSWGSVAVFDDKKRNMYMDFASYIRTQGFTVDQNFGELKIYSNRGLQRIQPTIYIDDRLLFYNDELSYYKLDFVDYIIVDKSGFGEGFRGAGGVIKIYTDPKIGYENNSYGSVFQDIEIPLTFTSPTKFYAPKYSSYTTSFYKEYGVIEWLPNLSADQNGTISFKISNQQANNINLFIEGTANNGSFLSEVKSIILN